MLSPYMRDIATTQKVLCDIGRHNIWSALPSVHKAHWDATRAIRSRPSSVFARAFLREIIWRQPRREGLIWSIEGELPLHNTNG
jgi:hypothetical protein